MNGLKTNTVALDQPPFAGVAPGNEVANHDLIRADAGSHVEHLPQVARSQRMRGMSVASRIACFALGAVVAVTALAAAQHLSETRRLAETEYFQSMNGLRPYTLITKVRNYFHPQSAHATAPGLVNADLVPREKVERTVEAYTSLLARELEKVRQYEDKLRKRASALESLLNDTLELDPSSGTDDGSTSESETEERYSNLDSHRQRMGVGGSDGPTTPIIRIPRSGRYRKSGPSPTLSPSEFLSDLDETIAKLDQLPLGTPVQGDVSSGFGWRRSPFSRSRKSHLHEGMDIAVDYNTEVFSTADGVVRNAGYFGAYGQTVVIDHGNGFETLYGHMSKVSVEVGQHVCRGQQVGLVGSSGRSTGPHVHYEIRKDGRPKNPEPFISLASLLRML